MTTKSFVIAGGIVGIVAGLTGGYFLGYARGAVAIKTSYAPKIAEVEAMLPPVPSTIQSLTGTVQAINGATLTLQVASGTFVDPFLADFPTTREVTITTTTNITSMTPISSTELQEEMQAYVEQLKKSTSTSEEITPPSSFTKTAISISDIKVGDTVIITASDNILSASSFAATSIQDEGAPVVP